MVAGVNKPDIENPTAPDKLRQHKKHLIKLKNKLNNFKKKLTYTSYDPANLVMGTLPMAVIGLIVMPFSAACKYTTCHDAVMGTSVGLMGGWICITAVSCGYAYYQKRNPPPTTFPVSFKLDELNNLLACLDFQLIDNNIKNALITISSAKEYVKKNLENPLPLFIHRISETLKTVGLFGVNTLVLEYCDLDEEKKSEQVGEKSRLLKF